MAFLNTVPFRPLCMMSALPKRYQQQLEKNLGGSVAVSTCRVEELEHAVKTRGASIAVVGAADDSLEIAERLSHAPEGVKVFLVHYQDRLAAKTQVNGFAGVFDVRLDQHRLAESIRQEALQPTESIQHTHSRLEQRRVLEHFIAINERLSSPTMAYELMLDGFLRLARSESGALLLAQDSSRVLFRVANSHNLPLGQSSELVLSSDALQQMSTGDVLFFPDGVPGFSDREWASGNEGTIGVPLASGSQLYGCLLAQSNEVSDVLADYGLMAGHLLDCLRRRKSAADREMLIARARNSVSTSWLLADSSGRIVHREGEKVVQGKNRQAIKSARLRHALHEALAGRSGSIPLGDRNYSYEALSAFGQDYSVIRLDHPKVESTNKSSMAEAEVIRLIKAHFSDAPSRGDVVSRLLETDCSQRLAPELDVKTVRSWGLEITSGPSAEAPKISPALALLMLGVTQQVSGAATFSIGQFDGRQSVTIEVKETALNQGIVYLASDPFIEMILSLTGIGLLQPRWSFGTFGGHLEYSLASS